MVGIHQLILADGLLNNPRCNEERDENLNRRGLEEEGEGGKNVAGKAHARIQSEALSSLITLERDSLPVGPSQFSQFLASR